MRKQFIVLASAAALATAPVMLGADTAQASGSNFVKGLIGGIVAGAVIGTLVRANQYHCHDRVCHRHGRAGPYHYHDAYGRILYQRPAAPPPPPPQPSYGGYPQAHYNWCSNHYKTYDAGSNTFQPYGNVPRKPCVSPYVN